MINPAPFSDTAAQKRARRADAIAGAQRRANITREVHAVWEHVGDYGRASGDIKATGVFKARSMAKANPPSDWALVVICDPEPLGGA